MKYEYDNKIHDKQMKFSNIQGKLTYTYQKKFSIGQKILRKYQIKTSRDKQEKFSNIYFAQIEKIPRLMQLIHNY